MNRLPRKLKKKIKNFLKNETFKKIILTKSWIKRYSITKQISNKCANKMQMKHVKLKLEFHDVVLPNLITPSLINF